MAAPRANAGGLTLRQCIDAAYGLSPNLKAEQLDIDAAGQEMIRQRTALLQGPEADQPARAHTLVPRLQDVDPGKAGLRGGEQRGRMHEHVGLGARREVVPRPGEVAMW